MTHLLFSVSFFFFFPFSLFDPPHIRAWPIVESASRTQSALVGPVLYYEKKKKKKNWKNSVERKKRKKDSRKEALVSLCLPREQHHQVNTGCF